MDCYNKPITEILNFGSLNIYAILIYIAILLVGLTIFLKIRASKKVSKKVRMRKRIHTVSLHEKVLYIGITLFLLTTVLLKFEQMRLRQKGYHAQSKQIVAYLQSCPSAQCSIRELVSNNIDTSCMDKILRSVSNITIRDTIIYIHPF